MSSRQQAPEQAGERWAADTLGNNLNKAASREQRLTDAEHAHTRGAHTRAAAHTRAPHAHTARQTKIKSTRMRHANRKATRARESPNQLTDPYVSWHCRKTVTGAASQAAGHSNACRSEISSEGRRRRPTLRTGFVRSDSDGKVHGRNVHEHSALAV